MGEADIKNKPLPFEILTENNAKLLCLTLFQIGIRSFY